MQNLEPILIFITVAETGSFTRAADSLGIQKGRASTAVRKLEEDLGVRLLHRMTRSVQLTEDGRTFHARARDLLAEVDDLHSMFAGDRVALRRDAVEAALSRQFGYPFIFRAHSIDFRTTCPVSAATVPDRTKAGQNNTERGMRAHE